MHFPVPEFISDFLPLEGKVTRVNRFFVKFVIFGRQILARRFRQV